MKYYSIAKLKAEFSRILTEVLRGEEVVVTDHNKPVAKVVSLKGYAEPPPPFDIKDFLNGPMAKLKPHASSSVALIQKMRDEQ